MLRSFSRRTRRDQRGQGLIEYLIIVALMGVATIAIMRTLGQAVSMKFHAAAAALQGETYSKKAEFVQSDDKKKDLGNFFNGAALKGGNGSQAD